MNEKYPPTVFTDDWEERVRQMPLQAFWADEDEPLIQIPDGAPSAIRMLPYHVALEKGIIRPA